MIVEPTDMLEYLRRFKANEQISGRGLETTVHQPCPFCASPNFWVYRLIDVRTVLGNEFVCVNCQRGARVLFVNTEGFSKFEIIQTTGPDQPAWLMPKVRKQTEQERTHAG